MSCNHAPVAGGPKLLIVDDEEPILFAVCSYFRTIGYRTSCARTMSHVDRLLDEHTFSCVIADLRLSGTHGHEGLDILDTLRVRASDANFVLLTAYTSLDIERLALERGADAVLSKPLSLPALAQRIATLIAQRQSTLPP